jgi:hypothetical protein
MKQLTFTLLLFLMTGLSLQAQKAAILGVVFDAGNPNHLGDQISFVALEDLPAGTKIRLTTEEYNLTNSAFCEIELDPLDPDFGLCVRTEEMITWEAVSLIPKGDVIVITKIAINNDSGPQAAVTCSSGAGCGNVSVIGRWDNSNDKEQVYLFEDNDDDMTNGVTSILSAVHYDMGGTPTTMPAEYDPSLDFPDVWIVNINTSTAGAGFKGFEMPDANRILSNLTQPAFEDAANYDATESLSLTSFCPFSVVCPADTDLGTYGCSTLGDIPDYPSLQDNGGDLTVDNDAGDYGIDLSDNICGNVKVKTSDDQTPDVCSDGNTTITRTVLIYDDANDNDGWDSGESSYSCTFTYVIEPLTEAVFDAPPADQTVCADAIPAKTSLSYSNGLSGNCAINGTDTNPVDIASEPGEDGCYTITRTWSAPNDACGRPIASASQTIYVIPEPSVDISMDIVGVDYPSSGTCDNFDVLLDVTVCNDGDVDIRNLNVKVNLKDYANGTLVGLVAGPTHVGGANLSAAFHNGYTGQGGNTQIFSGNAKLNKADDGYNCSTFRLRFEVAPSRGNASNAKFKATAQAETDCNALHDESTFDDSVVCSSDEASADVTLGNCWETSRVAGANDLINVSLIGCSAVITPDMILENHSGACDTGAGYPEGGFYRIRILYPGEQEPRAPELYATVDINDFPNGRVIVYIENVGKACEPLWGEVKLEDKTPPTISCPAPVSTIGNRDLLCSDLDEVLGNANINGIPKAVSNDNCGAPVLTFKDSVNDPADCGNTVLTRAWTVTDAQGRKATCNQTIIFRNPTLAEVSKPATELEVACDFDEALLEADDELTAADLFDNNGHPTPLALELLYGAGAGYPYVGDNKLDQAYCNLGASYDDIAVIEVCGNTVKIVRQWTILDWCNVGDQDELNNGTTVNHRQIIKFGDFSDPVLTDPGDKVYVNTGPFGCAGTFTVPGVDDEDVSENCSANLHVQVKLYKTTMEPTYDRYGRPTGEAPVTVEIGSVNVGSRVTIDLGAVYTLKYKVADDCGNVSNEVDLQVEAKDNTAPVAVCDDDLNISIGGQGLAKITAADLDEGSWDNCGTPDVYVSRKLATDDLRDAYLPFVYDGLTFDDLVLSGLDDWDNDSNADVYVIDENNNNKWDASEDHQVLRRKNGMWYTWWRSDVSFICEDVTDRVTLELLAIDSNGNTNVCWNNVLIEDKIRPVCNVAATVALDCTDLPYGFDPADPADVAALPGVTGATAVDNCHADAFFEKIEVVKWECNSGTIKRYFYAEDDGGLRSLNTCVQTITVDPVNNYEIIFPKDPAPVVCGEAMLDELETNIIGCDLLSINVVNDTFTASGTACYNIRRTYSIINWCEYDGESPAVAIGRDEDRDGATGEHNVYVLRDAVKTGGYNVYIDDDSNEKDGPLRKTVSTGYWTYIQYIKVIDNVAPVVQIGGDDVFCSFDNVGCDTEVTVPFTVTDECAGDDVLVKVFVDGVKVDLEEADYPNYSIKEELDLGEHEIEIHVVDGCGNSQLETKIIRVADCKAPSPICINGLAVELMRTEPGTDVDDDGEDDPGVMIIWATDFRVSMGNDCTGPVTLSINRVGETPDRENASLTLTCKDPDTLAVEIYAWDNADSPIAIQPGAVEPGGPNYDHCVTYVVIQDNMFNLCNDPGQIGVAGLITTEKKDPVEDVEVRLSGAQSMEQTTQVNGRYLFEQLTPGGDYTVAPRKNQDYSNGVSTFDIVLITKHILGTTRLTSPYKLIAADINRSNTVSTLDLIQLRKLVLSVDVKFRNNTSWRFIPANYEFPDEENPWSTPFPEVYSVNDIAQSELNMDFVAVKIGDLNGNARANSLVSTPRDVAGVFQLQVEDQPVTAGNEYRIAFTTEQLDIQGYQFTLQHRGLELIDIEYGVGTADNFGVIEEGVLTTSFNTSDFQLPASGLFTLVVRATTNGRLSELLSVNSRYTTAEAYDPANALLDVNLHFGKDFATTEKPVLYQNAPNPFQGRTVIGFELPAAAQATITIQDVTGKTLKMIRGEYARGYNQVEVNSGDLPGSGVLYYTLSTDKYTETKKMIVTNGF